MNVLKEILKRNFKLFRISVRCMGTGYMTSWQYQCSGYATVWYQSAVEVAFLLQGGRVCDKNSMMTSFVIVMGVGKRGS